MKTRLFSDPLFRCETLHNASAPAAHCYLTPGLAPPLTPPRALTAEHRPPPLPRWAGGQGLQAGLPAPARGKPCSGESRGPLGEGPLSAPVGKDLPGPCGAEAASALAPRPQMAKATVRLCFLSGFSSLPCPVCARRVAG